MSMARENTIRAGVRKVSKPYAIKVNEKSGKIYLKRERHPLFAELPYIFTLLTAVLFALLSCLQYIQLRTSVECRIRQTQAMESRLYALQSDNILTQKNMSYVQDLNYIYEVATGTLNMVPVSEANILFYDRSNSEYVYQRDNIPSIGLP